jgi:hypothetical protein
VASWSGFTGALVEVSALAVDVNAVAASVNPAIMMDLTVRLNCFISSIILSLCLFIQRVRLNATALFLPRRRQNPAIFLPIFKVSKPDETCKRRDSRAFQ